MDPITLAIGGIFVAAVDKAIDLTPWRHNSIADFLLSLLGKFAPEPTDEEMDALIKSVRDDDTTEGE